MQLSGWRIGYCLSLALVSLTLFLSAKANAAATLSGVIGNVHRISASEIAKDKALQSLVTVRQADIFVGELLDELSLQSGVNISASEKDSASGEYVQVRIVKIPLYKAMNAVCSLFSYKQGKWEWIRTTLQSGANQYRLQKTRKYIELSQSLNEEMNRDMGKRLDDYLAHLPKGKSDDPFLTAGHLFTDLVTPDQKNNLISGLEAEILIDGNQDDRVAEIVQGMIRKNLVLLPAADAVMFERDERADMITPTLFVMIGTKREGINGASGSLWEGQSSFNIDLSFQDEWREKLKEKWRVAENRDSASSTDLQDTVTMATDRKTQATVLQRLASIMSPKPLSFIARIPRETPDDFHAQSGGFNKYLEYLFIWNIDHKWNDDVLLLSRMRWFREEEPEAKPPWELVKWLRGQEEASPDGILSLKDLAVVAQRLSPKQSEALLTREFPHLKGYSAWRPFLLKVDANKTGIADLEQGVTVARLFRSQESAVEFPPPLDAVPANGTVKLIKTRKTDGADRSATFSYVIALTNPDGSVSHSSELTQLEGDNADVMSRRKL